MPEWLGYPCPDPTCRAYDPQTNPALCAACRERLGKVAYCSHANRPGNDLLVLHLLSAMRDGKPGLQAGMSERLEAPNAD